MMRQIQEGRTVLVKNLSINTAPVVDFSLLYIVQFTLQVRSCYHVSWTLLQVNLGPVIHLFLRILIMTNLGYLCKDEKTC